jgi:GNAT superfamily N-acetyltransferase
MELNESTFCSLWTKRIRLNNCADLFINETFSEDYFFNRVNNILYCHDITSVLDKSIRIFSEKRLKCYVYVGDVDSGDYDDDDDDPHSVMEKMLLEKRFNLLDTMQAFRSDREKIQYENHKIQVDKIDIALIPVWIDVFCKSFDVLEWKPELERILKLHFNELTLLVAYVKDNSSQIPAGCALLFNLHKTTGLYCLGTVPSFRRQGLAKKIIKVSLDIAMQQRTHSLILQAFTREGFQEFYKRLGFELVYKKRIYVS